MAIDADEVRRIAALAYLDLAPEQLARLPGELSAILGYVGRLDELDVRAVDPMAYPHEHGPALRADSAREGGDAEPALGNAPDSADGHFRVPQVIEE